MFKTDDLSLVMSLPDEAKFLPGTYYKSNKGKVYRIFGFWGNSRDNINHGVVYAQSQTRSNAGRKCYWSMVTGREMKRRWRSSRIPDEPGYYSFMERGSVNGQVEQLEVPADPRDVWDEYQKKIVRSNRYHGYE